MNSDQRNVQALQHDTRAGQHSRMLEEGSALPAMASAQLVNRTHRVVRERANAMQARRKLKRGLWLPLAISGGLLVALVFAIWNVLDESDLSPVGLPDAGQQIFVLLIWCIPISLAALAVVAFRRTAAHTKHGGSQ